MTQLLRLVLNPIHIALFPQEKDFYQLIKRLMDIVAAIVFIIPCIIALPFIAILIKLDSSGDVFYMQDRHGLNKKPFVIYKLRTMYSDQCDDGSRQAVHKDPRVTGIGRFLRRYSIDELPQLINVLKGDMSLVGPRPHAVPMDNEYERQIGFYNERFLIKPGITGLAQVEGSRGEIKSVQDMEDRILLDISYIRRQSFTTDVIILFKTLRIVFNKAC